MKTYHIVVTDIDNDVYTYATNYTKQDATEVAKLIIASRDCIKVEVLDDEQNAILYGTNPADGSIVHIYTN
jgi:hypothetical protein